METRARAAVSARISKDEPQSDSVEDQLQRCERYANEQGWQVVARYVDEGFSAWSDRAESRPGFNALVAEAKARKFDVVLVKLRPVCERPGKTAALPHLKLRYRLTDIPMFVQW